MTTYVYRWSLRPRPDIQVVLQIEAASVCAARREVDGFLRERTAGDWQVEGVSRAGAAGPQAAIPTVAVVLREA